MTGDPSAGTNALLNRLPRAVSQRLLKRMQRVQLETKQVLYEPQGPIDHAYFPIDCVLSAVTVMQDGSAIEVATVGKEGAVGLATFLGTDKSPHRVFAQICGDTLRIKSVELKEEANGDSPLAKLLARYFMAFLAQVSQSVACNGLHTLQQRCSRWLLMTHDRLPSDDVPLTHEFLAIMLGVRRAGVTEVLQSLQDEGMIRYGRGNIEVLNRKALETKSCECYQAVNEEYRRLVG